MATEIHGSCDEAFAPVRDAFAANFDSGLEVGASVYVTRDGVPVVDLWAGTRNDAGEPWERDTLVNVWSTTKTMAAITMLMLADRGEIDLDAPVAEYWPEFKANGKDGVLVRHVLAHSAGLPGWDPAIQTSDLADPDKACAVLAAQETWWEPGTKSGYHGITQGFLEWGIVRRVTGRTLGRFFADEVAGPLGADFYIGLPEEADDRVAQLYPPDMGLTAGSNPLTGGDVDPLALRALASCPLTGNEPNERWWRAAEIPAAGGTGNARSVGRVHSALACDGEVDGVRLMSAKTLDRVLEEQTNGIDAVLGWPMRYGIGFGLMSEATPLSANERAFFWGGWGGSIALIDRDARMTVTYTMNKMTGGTTGDMRAIGCIFGAYQALANGA
ncbi:MAG TPA: serine hydrolase domain-containing protein [Acidimicrobiales bacterium]|jgi:CubicO group peptidase (beta-lactamase class C family)|nr:serine hydrolase domain-containing protein [Acidimicrobiales bacterium]